MEKANGGILKLKDGLILVSVEDKAAVLDVQNRCYYDLNDTAAFLLKLMEGGCLYEDMKTDLVARFDVAGVTAGADLDDFVLDLSKLSLVEIGGEAGFHKALAGLKKRHSYQAPRVERQAEILVGVAVSGRGFKWI